MDLPTAHRVKLSRMTYLEKEIFELEKRVQDLRSQMLSARDRHRGLDFNKKNQP